MFFVKIHKLIIPDTYIEVFKEKVFFIKIKYGEQERVTTTKHNNVCPIWEESFVFDKKEYIEGVTFQIIEVDKKGLSKIYRDYTFRVNYEEIRGYHNLGSFICFSMGGLYFLKNERLSELKYDLKNALRLILERDSKIVLISKNLKKTSELLEKYKKKIFDIKKITIS